MKNATVARSIFAVATTITSFTIAPAQSQTLENFYIGGNAGFVFAGNTRADGIFSSTGSTFDGQRLGPAPGDTAEGNFDPSFTANLTFGYDFGKRRFGRLRLEGELFIQNADTDSYEGELNGSALEPVGEVETTMAGVAVNAVYDFFQISRVTPYAFLGIGRANVDTTYIFPGRGRVDVDGTSEILQGGFGANIPLRDRTLLDLKYRFRRAGLNEAGLDADIDAHIVEIGVRYSF